MKEIAGFDRGPNASIIATVQTQNPLYRVTLVPSAIVLEISCNKANWAHSKHYYPKCYLIATTK